MTSPLEAPAVLHPLAALSVSKTMWTTSQKARLTVRQAAAVGKGTSRPVQETTMAPGHGEIVHSHQDKGPLVLSRRRRDLDGRLVSVVQDFRPHSQGTSGCQGEEAHVFVPRPGQSQQLDTRYPVIEVANRRHSNSAHQDWRRWSQRSSDQSSAGTGNTPAYRRRGCYV